MSITAPLAELEPPPLVENEDECAHALTTAEEREAEAIVARYGRHCTSEFTAALQRRTRLSRGVAHGKQRGATLRERVDEIAAGPGPYDLAGMARLLADAAAYDATATTLARHVPRSVDALQGAEETTAAAVAELDRLRGSSVLSEPAYSCELRGWAGLQASTRQWIARSIGEGADWAPPPRTSDDAELLNDYRATVTRIVVWSTDADSSLTRATGVVDTCRTVESLLQSGRALASEARALTRRIRANDSERPALSVRLREDGPMRPLALEPRRHALRVAK